MTRNTQANQWFASGEAIGQAAFELPGEAAGFVFDTAEEAVTLPADIVGNATGSLLGGVFGGFGKWLLLFAGIIAVALIAG